MALTRIARPMLAATAVPRAVTDYGAVGDGVASAAAAVGAMAAALGFVRFERGNYRMTTATIDVPVFFEEGAYLTVDAANTVTITHTITAPRQHIFRGPGLVALSSDSNSGENARQIHVSWFGAFASSSFVADQAPAIQRAATAMGNGRESEILFDQGNYHITTGPITLTRGCHIRGAGTRRTVFRLGADGFDVFQSGNVACKWSDIQFEVEAPLSVRNTGAYVRVSHGECEVYDCQFFGGRGVVTTGNNTRVDNVVGTFGVNLGAGSALVHVAGGSGARVSNVMAGTSSFGPEAMVRIGGTGATSVSGVLVENISHIAPAASVHIEAFSADVQRVAVTGVAYNGFAGSAPAYAVKLATSGTADLVNVQISDVVVSAYASNGMLLEQTSSGRMALISLDGVTVSGSGGTGIQFTRTAGTLEGVKVGDTVNVLERATPYGYTGMTTVAAVRIDPLALPDAAPATCWNWTIEDDAVRVLDLQRSVFSGIGLLSVSPTVGTVQHGVFVIRAAVSPSVTAVTTLSAGVAAATGVHSGTTGTDGKLTISATEGKLYFENRLGSAQSVHFSLLTGL